MLPNELYVEIFYHIKDLETLGNYVRCNKCLAAIGRKHKEIQHLLIPQVVNLDGSNIEKYSVLPNQRKHGLYQKYNTYSNTVIEQCNYINGKKEGYEQMGYDIRSGQIRHVAFYVNGLLKGEFKRWTDNNELMDKINYANGVKHGLCQRWTTNGILLEKAEYIYGQKYDHEVFDGAGNPYLSIKYTSPSDYKYLAWYRLSFYGTRRGSNGLMCRRKYKNNVLHGSWKTWHPNGQLKKRVKYENGLKQGLSENWNANGDKIQEIYYVDNIKQGYRLLWNECGTLIWNTLYVNGRAT